MTDGDARGGDLTRRTFLTRTIHAGLGLAGASIGGLSYVHRLASPPPARAAGTRSLTFSIEAGTAKTRNVLDNLAAFTQKTGIQVRPVEIPLENQREKIMADMFSGTPQFDASMILAEAYLPQFAAANLLEPLDTHISRGQLADLSPLARHLSTYEGKLFGWPWFEHTVGILFYRTDLLKEAGLVTASGAPAPPETWPQLVDSARKLTKGDTYGFLVEAKRDQEPFWRFLGLLWQAGGDILDDRGRVVLNSPEAVEALQFQVDLIHKHKVTPPGSFNYYNVDNHTLFVQGKLAMTENWPYMVGLAKAPGQSQVVGKFDIAPTVGHRKRTWSVNGFTWIIPRKARNKAEAVEFLNWVTSREMLIDLGKRYQLPMSRRSLHDAQELTQFAHTPTVLRIMEMGRTIPLHRRWAEMRDAIIDEWQAALLLRKSPREAMQTAAERVQRIVRR